MSVVVFTGFLSSIRTHRRTFRSVLQSSVGAYSVPERRGAFRACLKVTLFLCTCRYSQCNISVSLSPEHRLHLQPDEDVPQVSGVPLKMMKSCVRVLLKSKLVLI